MSSHRKHLVVALDSWVQPPDVSFEHEMVKYVSTSPSELAGRIRDATIILISATPIPRAAIEGATRLQLVACNSTGTDHVDKEALRERQITLCRVPAQNTESVSEHAFALYFALRRRIISMHAVAADGELWATGPSFTTVMGKPPRVNSEETLVIVGYGALGQNVEKIGRALGMRVLVAERKGATSVREGRTAFSDAIRQGTIFILVTPLDASTRDMISTAEFAAMDPTALIVNVGRGGVINEAALVAALKDGSIGGAATDVFEREPATKESCPLLDKSIPNLILSPHVAWYSSKTLKGTVATTKANLEAFAAGNPQNVVL